MNECVGCISTVLQGSHVSWKENPGFFQKFPGPGKSWKLEFKAPESPGI